MQLPWERNDGITIHLGIGTRRKGPYGTMHYEVHRALPPIISTIDEYGRPILLTKEKDMRRHLKEEERKPKEAIARALGAQTARLSGAASTPSSPAASERGLASQDERPPNANMAPKRAASPSASTSKKAKLDLHGPARALVSSLLDEAVDVEAKDARLLAEYARSLEEQVEASKPKQKSADEIKALSDKLGRATASGIKKQLSWKPSAKTNSAKFAYDGVCADQAVFASMLGLELPIKKKKWAMESDALEAAIGNLDASIRYGSLSVKGSVNIHYSADEGTFKIIGTYGLS